MAGSKGLLLLCILVILSLVHLALADWSSQFEDDWYYQKPPKNNGKPFKKHTGGYYNGKPFVIDEDDGGYNSNYDDSEKLMPYHTQPYYKSSPLNKPKPMHKPRLPLYKPTLPYKPPQKTPPIYKPPPKQDPPAYKPPPQETPAPAAYKPPQSSPTPVYPPPSTPAYTPSSASSSWERQWLDPHNAARAELGLPPMVWSDKVAQYAESWANQRKASGCGLQHSDGPLYGENIFWGSGGGYGPAECVAAWVSEKQYYNYADNSCVPGQQCGHYTQIVWASSVNLGCAKVQCESGQIFMTCNYDPPGNWIGSKPY